MSAPFIIDAHLHIGLPGVFLAPETDAERLIAIMDRLRVRAAVCTDHVSLANGAKAGLPLLRRVFEESGGRIFYQAVYDPNSAGDCLAAMEEAAGWPGLVGLKIHPSFHRTTAEDPAYRPAWEFAARHDLAILTHSWSVSDHNPVQKLSTPERFEGYVREFPGVRFVLGHAGGRGSGRKEAVRMAREYPNVYLDFAGDVFCYRLLEDLTATLPAGKILFGSDYPWLDPRANLTRVLLARIGESAQQRILVENAATVYKIPQV